MEYKDYYAVLGVPRTASDKEIKKAFRKLAREHHPDVKGGDAAAEQRFKEVNEANAVLSDPDKRALYDRLGNDWEAYAAGAAPAPVPATGARAGAAGGGNPFGGAAGFGGARWQRPLRVPHDRRRRSSATSSTPSSPAPPSPCRGPGRGRRPTGGATFEDILAGMGLGADGATASSAGGRGAAHGGRGRTCQAADRGGHRRDRRSRRPITARAGSSRSRASASR